MKTPVRLTFLSPRVDKDLKKTRESKEKTADRYPVTIGLVHWNTSNLRIRRRRMREWNEYIGDELDYEEIFLREKRRLAAIRMKRAADDAVIEARKYKSANKKPETTVYRQTDCIRSYG